MVEEEPGLHPGLRVEEEPGLGVEEEPGLGVEEEHKFSQSLEVTPG